MEHIDDLCIALPDRTRQIRLLALRDPKFRAICDDYGEALRAIEFWRRRKGASKNREAEYSVIATELREEVRQYLITHSQS